MKTNLDLLIQKRIKEIQIVYKNDNRPWILGYSGGKDSTVTAQLVIHALQQLPKSELHKPVYIVSSDTMVENPLILNYLENNINLMNQFFKEHLPTFNASMVYPEIKDTFWTLVIGRGYPTPRQKFRWCTSRLKIKPINGFIDSMTQKHEEVIVVLGVRNDESNSRRESIENHTIEGKILKTHSSNKNAFVYAPIEDFTYENIWEYLLKTPSHWGGNNKTLLSLYQSSSESSECPLQQDLNSPSCGKSRFGCWTCSVVSKDKSLTGFIREHEELEPLLDFRNTLCDMRNKPEYRQKWRMNGAIYFLKDSEGNKKRGLGPFNLEARKLILTKLLETQELYNDFLVEDEQSLFNNKSSNYIKLITDEELKTIRQFWIDDGDWADELPKIYTNILNKEFPFPSTEKPMINKKELDILERICSEEDVEIDLIKKLAHIENKYMGFKHRSGILNDMDKVLKQDWVHEELFELEEGDDSDEN